MNATNNPAKEPAMKTETAYVVLPAPGYYGDTTRVLSAHRTLAAALRAARRGYHCVVRASTQRKGSTWYRDFDHNHPIVTA